MRALLLCVCMVVSSPAFSDQSIHRMVVGDRALELQYTIPLTFKEDREVIYAWLSPDGKYIAYLGGQPDPEVIRLGMIRSSGGRPTILLSTPTDGLTTEEPAEGWYPEIDTDLPIVWSPDSKLIAFYASHSSADGNPPSKAVWIMTTRDLRASFDLPEHYSWCETPMLWSPDSSRLACVCERPIYEPKKPFRQVTSILIFDLIRKSSASVFSQEKADVALVSWSSNSLRFAVSKDGRTEIRESKLDGSSDQLEQTISIGEKRSPDGRSKLAVRAGLYLEDCATGEQKEVFKEFTGRFVGWTPDSKMVVYRKPDTIRDEVGKRTRTLNEVWLAAPDKHSLNHMCVVLDAEPDCIPSFSKDCLKMAYISDGRLYIAGLGWVNPTTEEKLAVGLPLTEEDEKEALIMNAKQIGVAFNMYTSDNDDKYPSADTYMQDVLVYSRNESLFNRPGTNQPIFQYFPLSGANDSPATTVMGMFDVGYGWKVVLYADGYVQVVPK